MISNGLNRLMTIFNCGHYVVVIAVISAQSTPVVCLQSHLTECDYAIVSCPNKGCSEIMERKSVENHARDDCPKYILSCPHCQRHVRREEERKHMHSCHKRPVSCPNKCGQPDMSAAQVRSRSHHPSLSSLPVSACLCLSLPVSACLCLSLPVSVLPVSACLCLSLPVSA